MYNFNRFPPKEFDGKKVVMNYEIFLTNKSKLFTEDYEEYSFESFINSNHECIYVLKDNKKLDETEKTKLDKLIKMTEENSKQNKKIAEAFNSFSSLNTCGNNK